MNPATNHAKIRYQQRGINRLVADYLIEYGEANYAPHGAVKITLTKRNSTKIISSLKKAINNIERARSVTLVEKDGVILTRYHRTRT